jgi:enoyl-[acyl-carrier protein] reductase II
MHVMPSVRAALRCQKAGVDVVIASGHEGGFHASWEPVHSMVLLPAVVDVSGGISGEA